MTSPVMVNKVRLSSWLSRRIVSFALLPSSRRGHSRVPLLTPWLITCSHELYNLRATDASQWHAVLSFIVMLSLYKVVSSERQFVRVSALVDRLKNVFSLIRAFVSTPLYCPAAASLTTHVLNILNESKCHRMCVCTASASLLLMIHRMMILSLSPTFSPEQTQYLSGR